MKIRLGDKLRLIASAWSAIPRLPYLRLRLATLLVPVDSVRYIEFAYFIRFLRSKNVTDKKILSVSSPHMMAYLLSEQNSVTAINLDSREGIFFKESKNLHFQTGDATRLPFPDATFDIVYSISVIEHIYERYGEALREMARVTKPGGFVYISCPIAREHTEEWLDEDAYGVQAQVGSRSFFQYRFSETDIARMLQSVPELESVCRDHFWERRPGRYDTMIARMRRNHRTKNRFLKLLISAWLNLAAGLWLFENEPRPGFASDSRIGNLHIILRKKELA